MDGLKKILLVEHADYAPEYMKDGQNHVDRNLLETLTVCPIDDTESAFGVSALIKADILPNNVASGQVFMRSPYDDNKYIRLDDFELTVMQDKARHIVEVARILGATKCEYDIEITSMVLKEQSADGNVNIQDIIQVDASYVETEKKRLKNSIQVEQEYPCAKVPTNGDHEKAIGYAKEHHIRWDVEDLLRARSPETKNMLGKRTVTVMLNNEINADLNVATRLNILGNVVSVGANYKKSMQYERQIIMKMKYEFAMPELTDDND